MTDDVSLGVAYILGRKARREFGEDYTLCPYLSKDLCCSAWMSGYCDEGHAITQGVMTDKSLYPVRL